LATAISQSLWQWMPIGVLNCAATFFVMSKMTSGKVPPLVSHRHRQSAPASAAALQGGERVVRVGLVAVEEVLGVVDHFLALLLEMAHGVADHAQVLVELGAQDFGDLVVPALAEDGHCVGAGGEDRAHVAVVLGLDADLARGAEGDQLGVLQLHAAHALEEFQVLRVGAGVAGLDVMHAERVEALDDLDLVLHGIRDALGLGAVAQCGIVDGNPFHP
jgi:hypothetical protein